MTTLYKLTTKDYKTRKGKYNECQWGEGVSHSGKGVGDLCGEGYIHAYTHPLLAVLLNPLHAAIEKPVLWECVGDVVLSDKGLKVGCVTLTTVRRVPLPEITTTQRIAFGILCAKAVYKEAAWNEWANGWLNGAQRSARPTSASAFAAAYAASAASASAASDAAYAASAYAPAIAAFAAAYAASATAADARGARQPLDLIKLAQKAMEYK